MTIIPAEESCHCTWVWNLQIAFVFFLVLILDLHKNIQCICFIKCAILDIFLHSMQQKWDQGTLGTQRSSLIGSRTRLGPSMDPAMALQYT